MSCTSCLSNNDIQTTDQVRVPSTTPYFHKDTLTPPSRSRSPPLEGGGPSTLRPAMHLYNNYITHALYFDIYTMRLEVIQLMSFAGFEAYICMCFCVYKHYVQPSYGCRGTRIVAGMCIIIYCAKILKVLEQERKTFKK